MYTTCFDVNFEDVVVNHIMFPRFLFFCSSTQAKTAIVYSRSSIKFFNAIVGSCNIGKQAKACQYLLDFSSCRVLAIYDNVLELSLPPPLQPGTSSFGSRW